MSSTTGGKIDKAKGRVKQAAGDLLDEPHLKREGKKDVAKGTVKEKIDQVADKAEKAADKIAHGRKRTINRDNM